MSLVWINGTLVDKADARVSPFDHGFLYGDGAWEPLRVYGGRLYRPDEHVRQLLTAATVLSIDIPLSQSELISAIEATVRANNRTDGYVRVIVTRGAGTIGPDPRKLDPQVVIIAEEYQPFPAELYAHGLHVVTAETRLDPSNPGHVIRVLGQPHIVLAKQQALRSGCLEALFITTDGNVAGCTEGTVLLVRNGAAAALTSYPPDATWLAVLDLAPEASQRVPLSAATRDELLAADEVFLAGTSSGVIGIVRVDDHSIGTGTEGPITRRIRHAYRQLTRGE